MEARRLPRRVYLAAHVYSRFKATTVISWLTPSSELLDLPPPTSPSLPPEAELSLVMLHLDLSVRTAKSEVAVAMPSLPFFSRRQLAGTGPHRYCWLLLTQPTGGLVAPANLSSTTAAGHWK